MTGQAEISAEIAAIQSECRRAGSAESQPKLDFPPYRSSVLRHPKSALHLADPEAVELRAPCFGEYDVAPLDADLTVQHAGPPIGERTVVTGRILDGDGRPVRRQLVEIWQANASGRYVHQGISIPHRWTPISPVRGGASPTTTGSTGSRRSNPARTLAQPPQRLASRAHPFFVVRK